MRVISASVLVLAIAACAPSPAPEPAQAPAPATEPAPAPAPEVEPPVVGGYGPANLEDPMVKEAQAAAVDAIYTRDPTRALVENVEAEQQVVAGMNYRFTITMSGGAMYGVTVFRSLDGKMEVTEYAKLP